MTDLNRNFETLNVPYSYKAIVGRAGGNFIQWKGTNVCIDVQCPSCGLSVHLDTDFLYSYKCPNPFCRKVWEFGTEVTMRETEDSHLVDYAKHANPTCDDCDKTIIFPRGNVGLMIESDGVVKSLICKDCYERNR